MEGLYHTYIIHYTLYINTLKPAQSMASSDLAQWQYYFT